MECRKNREQEVNLDLMGMILEERIDMLLSKKQSDQAGETLRKAEAVVDRLPDEDRAAIEKWLDLSMDMEAENQRKAYLGGLMDGIWLSGKVYLTGMDGMLSLEKWLEKMRCN